MKRLGAILGIVALTALTAAAQQKPAPKGAATGDEAAIGKIRSAYEKAALAQDAAAIAKLFAADGEEMPPNAPASKGRAAIEAYQKRFAQEFMMHGIKITPAATHVIGDVAYEVGTVKQSLMAQKGGAMIDDTGKYVVILKKDAGNWLIQYLIFNSDNPPPGMPAPKK
jgi:uncharacterized protein (TIGR02246 family)